MATRRKVVQNHSALTKGFTLADHQIVVRPIVSEKGTHLAERHNIYCFEVHAQATKAEIKRAVEHLFDVKVQDVRTQLRKGKPKRFRKQQEYKLPTWKKALVLLSEEHRITLF
jgi:large subunit ribosomal protein L23